MPWTSEATAGRCVPVRVVPGGPTLATHATLSAVGSQTGTPSLCSLTSDAAELIHHLPHILRKAGLEDAPCVLAGRSLGSACAIELAARFEARFVGLILESAMSSLLELPMVAEALGESLAGSLPDPFLNCAKLARLRQMRVLVLHGVDDELVPAAHAETLYGGNQLQL